MNIGNLFTNSPKCPNYLMKNSAFDDFSEPKGATIT